MSTRRSSIDSYTAKQLLAYSIPAIMNSCLHESPLLRKKVNMTMPVKNFVSTEILSAKVIQELFKMGIIPPGGSVVWMSGNEDPSTYKGPDYVVKSVIHMMNSSAIAASCFNISKDGRFVGSIVSMGDSVVDTTRYRADKAFHYNEDVAVKLLYLYGKDAFHAMAGDLFLNEAFVSSMAKFGGILRLLKLLLNVRPTSAQLTTIFDAIERNVCRASTTYYPGHNRTGEPPSFCKDEPVKTINFMLDHHRWPQVIEEVTTGRKFNIAINQLKTTLPLETHTPVKDSGGDWALFAAGGDIGSLYLSIAVPGHETDIQSRWTAALMPVRCDPKTNTIECAINKMPSCIHTISEFVQYLKEIEKCSVPMRRVVGLVAETTPHMTFKGLMTTISILAKTPENFLDGIRYDILYDPKDRLIYFKWSKWAGLDPAPNSESKPTRRALPTGFPEHILLGTFLATGFMDVKDAKLCKSNMKKQMAAAERASR